MTKVLGQQQFSQLWNQFQTTNSHLFQDGGQLKSSLSTNDVQQLLTTVKQDGPDDAQLFGVHCLLSEHADAFENDDLALLRMEVDGLGLDFSQFVQPDEAASLANAGKRFGIDASQQLRNKRRSKREAFVLQSEPGHVWDLKSEEGILRAFEMIVAQDEEYFPGEDIAQTIGFLTAGPKYALRRYRFGGVELNLDTVVRRYGNAVAARRGIDRPPPRELVEMIQAHFGWQGSDKKYVDIVDTQGRGWDFESQEGLLYIFASIVTQDKSIYPDEEVSVAVGAMTTMSKKRDCRYRFGDEEMSFWSLLSKFKKTLLGKYDVKELRMGLVVNEIKRMLGWKQPGPDTVSIKLCAGKRWDLKSDEGILEAIRAIVEQDKEHYLGDEVSEAVGALTTGKRVVDRRYRFGANDVSLHVLISRLRKLWSARDGRRWGAKAVVDEIKRRFGWVEPASTAFRIDAPVGHKWDLRSEEGIVQAIAAIVTQDNELYPDDDVEYAVDALSTSQERVGRSYRLGDEEIRLGSLINRIRVARGYRAKATKKLPSRIIVAQIKEALRRRDDAPIIQIAALSGHVWSLDTEEGVIAAIRAIIEQDKELYPGNDVAVAVDVLSSKQKYMFRRYRFSDVDMTMYRLMRRYWKLRGRWQSPGRINSGAIQYIKRLLGWREFFVLRDEPAGGWDMTSEEGILKIMRSILSQDQTIYSQSTLEEAARSMRLIKGVTERRYRIGGEMLSFGVLLDRFGTAVALSHGVNTVTRPQALKVMKDYILGRKRLLRHVGKIRFRGFQHDALRIEKKPGEKWDFGSEEGIFAIFKAIIEQDNELFPDGFPASLGSLSTTVVQEGRSYLCDDKGVSFRTLFTAFRRCRGIAPKDNALLPDHEIIGLVREHFDWRAEDALLLVPSNGEHLDLETEEGMFEVFKVVLEQDVDVYSDNFMEALGRLSTDHSYLSRLYQIGHKTYTLGGLFGRFRSVRGLNVDRQDLLPGADIVRLIRKRFAWRSPRALYLEHPEGKKWDLETADGVTAVIKRVLEKDREVYPGDLNDALGSLVADNRFLLRYYQLGYDDYSLLSIFSKLRAALGMPKEKGYSRSEVIDLVRERLAWRAKDALYLSPDEGEIWDVTTEEGLLKIVRAILEQDNAFYPQNFMDALEELSGNHKFLKRRYQLGVHVRTMGGILRRLRDVWKAGGDAVTTAGAVRRIREHFNWRSTRALYVEPPESGRWDLDSEVGVYEVFRAIFEQDTETFSGDPSEAAGLLSTASKYNRLRYQIGVDGYTFRKLFSRVRQLRGFKSTDLGALSDADVIRAIREYFSWRAGDSFYVRPVAGEKWDLHSEEGVLTVFKAIFAQDREYFSGDLNDSLGFTTAQKDLLLRRYQIGNEQLAFVGLIGRLRGALGFGAGDLKSMTNYAVVLHLRKRLGWRSKRALYLEPEGREWDLTTEEGLLEVIGAIFKQDRAVYPDDVAEASALVNTTDKHFNRYYQVGYEDYSLRSICYKFRLARGLKAADFDSMPDGDILALIRRHFGGMRYAGAEQIASFVEKHQLDPVISLLSDAPSHLRNFLEIFFQDELDGPAATHLVRTFSGLKLYTEIHQTRAPENNLEILIGAMLMRHDRLLNSSAHDVERALRILQYVMGRHFENDFDAAEQLVVEAAEKQDDQKVKDLLGALSTHYRKGRHYSVNGIATNLFLYQRLGVQHLVNNDSAILADDPGLGKTLQALAAAEKLREEGKVKKVLIIAPARVKGEWEREIAKHLENADQIKIVKIDGDVAAKSQQVQDAADADYIILNYEFLRGKTPEELAPILENLDLLIADEAQKMSNPSEDVQQAEAVRNIEAPRKWLLTATPYYSHPEYVFSLLKYLNPDHYGSFKEFRHAFTTDIMGLRLLHGELEGVMLRRSIAETLGEYQPGMPIEQQGVKMPRRDVVPPEEEGHYDLSRGQVELLRELSQDIRGWMVRRGYGKKMTHFTHLKYLYHATVDPALLGEDIDSPIYDKLDRVVMKRLAQGKKVLIYAHHQEVVRKIRRRYEHLGAVQFNGDSALKDEQKEANLNAFETDPDTRIMVAGVESGGTGLNIKAADVIVNVERTLNHSAKVQSEGRPQRLSPENPKESYEIVTLIPRYPKELLESEADPQFREFMEQGTVSEILEGRLADLDRVYRLVMDGLVAESDAQKQSRKLLVQGFSGLQKVNINDIDTSRRRKAFAAAGAFYQLWDRCREDRAIQVRIQQLATLFHNTNVSPQGLVNALADIDVLEERDFDWLMSPFSESNKYLRDVAVQMLFPLVKLFGDVELSLSDIADGLASPSSKVARVVLPLMTLFHPWKNEELAKSIKNLLAEIESAPSSIRGQAITSLMAMSTSLGQSGNGRFRDFVSRHTHVFGDEDISITRRTSVLERLALYRELSVEGYEQVVEGTYADIDALSQSLKARQWQTLANEFGLEWDDETEANIARLHGSWGDFRPLMGLLNGMQRFPGDYGDEIAQLKEIFVHAVRGDLREWRNVQSGNRTSGNKIEYLARHPDFWREWSREDETLHDEVVVEAGIRRHILGEEYEHLVRLLQLAGDGVIQDGFVEFERGDEVDRKKLIKRVGSDKRALAKASRKRPPTADDMDVAQRYGVGEDGVDLIGTALRRVNRLFTMLRVLSSISAWSQCINDADLNVREVINALRQMALGLADSVGETEKQLREQFDRMRHFLEASGKERTYENVRIYDTDDPNIIMRLGALAPDMVNCFNHHGNPAQNHVLTGALGSRNFRVVVVEVNGRIRAAAPVKIRKTDDERPVIFLERGLFSGRYNFEREMLGHLQGKARRMDRKPIVSRQIMKPRPEDVTVYSTGSYSKNEYAEALFGVRESDAVYHLARVVFDPREQ